MRTNLRRINARVTMTMLTIIAALVTLVFALPLVWALVSALRPSGEIFKFLSPLSPRVLIPKTVTLDNFVNVLTGPFGRAAFNSLVVAGATVVVGLMLCASAAFGLSAIRFRFRNALFAVVVISFLVPFEAIAIPLSSVFRSWGLENTYAGLILPALGNGLAIFQLRQFFLGIPIELQQAARVDGAGWWTIFWRIYIPLSRPALVGAALILFLFQWQAYLWPLLITTDSEMDVAPVALGKFVGQFQVDYGQMFAGAVIVAVIPALILLAFQRYFTQSVAKSGLKE